MKRHLLIAGHGQRKDGTFDPGATGFITKGEHRYMKEDLFPAMKKYANDSFIFFDSYNVFSHGDIVALAKKYNADTVTEFHYDASGSAQASGGHVIVYSHFKPDAMDLRLRDAIDSMAGVRYSHAGHRGISGRSNLANVNRTASGRVNYRMLELGFGTNAKDADVMLNQTDQYAKKLVEAIKGSKSIKPSTPTPIPPSAPANKSISQMADEVEGMLHGSGHANRQKSLGVNSATYAEVRAEVNRRAGVSAPSKPQPVAKSISQMATEVIAGKHGSGHSNRRRSLGISQAEYDKVRAEVNRRAGVKTAPTQSVSQMANRILTSKGVPNGHEARRKWLGVDNATYQKVRAEVNRRLK